MIIVPQAGAQLDIQNPLGTYMKKVTDLPQYAYLVEKIRSLMAGRTKPFLVALDGRSGVGKSTMAQSIVQEMDGIIVMGDDFFAGGPDCEWDVRSAEAKVADCIDWRRLRKEALEPLLAGKAASLASFQLYYRHWLL